MKNAIILIILSILTATAVAAFDPGFGADVSVTTEGSKILITGTTFDMPEGTSVQLWCSERPVGEFPIDSNGAFSIETVYGGIKGCGSGIATLKAGNANTNVTLPPQLMMVPTGGSDSQQTEGSNGQKTVIVSASESTHMPEFSTITLAVAVLGVGLGLALLRKQ